MTNIKLTLKYFLLIITIVSNNSFGQKNVSNYFSTPLSLDPNLNHPNSNNSSIKSTLDSILLNKNQWPDSAIKTKMRQLSTILIHTIGPTQLIFSKQFDHISHNINFINYNIIILDKFYDNNNLKKPISYFNENTIEYLKATNDTNKAPPQEDNCAK
jgi:hypothetical protein